MIFLTHTLNTAQGKQGFFSLENTHGLIGDFLFSSFFVYSLTKRHVLLGKVQQLKTTLQIESL